MNYIAIDNVNIYSSQQNDYQSVHTPINFNIYLQLTYTPFVSQTRLLDKTFSQYNLLDNLHYVQTSYTFSNFLFLRQSTITAFFSTNLIDMPICFKKSKSLYAKTFELPLLKFTNLIMRGGLREQVIKNITLSFTKCFTRIFKYINLSNYIQWEYLYSHITTISYISTPLFTTNVLTSSLELHSKHLIAGDRLVFSDSLFLTKFLFNKLNEFLPLFSFYIRKVDKNIRKHSRGKSGKYTIIWKYVPIYKRLYITIRWLLKDLKFQKSQTFTERLFKTVETFLTTPETSFVYKLRKFTHYFVFQNFKKTLFRTLKSTS
jgi:hypothetical protein